MKNASPITAVDMLRDRHQTCGILGVKTSKYWDLIREGKLEVVRLGKRCTRVKQSSIDRLISGESS